jgi:hypothetical protein
MKTMVAIWEKPGFLILLQLAQTDCALQTIYEILGFIHKNGQSL